MRSIGILWNSMVEYNDLVLNDLYKLVKIKSYLDLDLKNNLSEFIFHVYESDLDIVKKRIREKIKYTDGTYNLKIIRIIIMEIDDKMISDNKLEYIKYIKNFIRKKYSSLIDIYNYDNVFHMTEDKEEFDKIINALRFCYKESNKLVLKKYN